MTPLLKSLSDLRNFEYGNFIVFRNSLPFELITRVRRLSSDEPQGILVMMYLVIAEGAGGVNQPPLFNVVEGELEVWKSSTMYPQKCYYGISAVPSRT
jgi:hypothetical protein